MSLKPSPLTFLVAMVAGWITRQQVIVIEYLKAENRMLRERIKGRSLRFTDQERALLALRGLVTYHVLFMIELAKRIAHIVGMTSQPNEGWMVQVARNLTDPLSGALVDKSHLVLHRDTKYSAQFRRLIAESRTAVIRLPPRSPNLNAFAERFVRSIKEECLDRMIFLGQGSLRRALTEFVTHYHHERNHQDLDNRLIASLPVQQMSAALVQRRQRLGGILSFYRRAGA